MAVILKSSNGFNRHKRGQRRIRYLWKKGICFLTDISVMAIFEDGFLRMFLKGICDKKDGIQSLP
jgi:hypothetical protein